MISRIVLVALAAAITCTGVAFAGVALFLFLSETTSAAGAAALTALIFFAIVGFGVLIYLALTRQQAPTIATAALGAAAQPRAIQEDALVPALTQLAKDHPLIAVGCAAALGVADAMKNR